MPRANRAGRGQRRTAVFLPILFFAYLAAGASAQEKDWEKQWNYMIAAARKEGKVIVATSPDAVMRQEIIPRFKARKNARSAEAGADSSRGRRSLQMEIGQALVCRFGREVCPESIQPGKASLL